MGTSCESSGPIRSSQAGVALLLVLWVLILLTVIVGQFCYTMRTETNMTRNFRDAAQADYLARAGLKRAIYAIMTSDDKSGAGLNLWRVNADIPALNLAGGSYKVQIGNESGKINLNSADDDLLKLLVSGLKIARKERVTIVHSILDWRDGDNLHRGLGAENAYYTSLPEPYRASNGPFNDTYELLRVKGVTREIFENSFRDRVTVYPEEVFVGDDAYYEVRYKNEEVEPDRININAAPESLLLAIPGVSRSTTEKINRYRKSKDIDSQSVLLKIVGAKPFRKMIDYITFDYSPYYDIEVTGRVSDSRVSRSIKALVYINRGADKYRILNYTIG